MNILIIYFLFTAICVNALPMRSDCSVDWVDWITSGVGSRAAKTRISPSISPRTGSRSELSADGHSVYMSSNPSSTDLMAAVNGEIGPTELSLNAVKRMIQARINLNENDGEALISVLQKPTPSYRMLSLLLAGGADPNVRDGEALTLAAPHGYLLTQSLVEHGADVPEYGGQALMIAAEKGNYEVVRVLRAKGAPNQEAALLAANLQLEKVDDALEDDEALMNGPFASIAQQYVAPKVILKMIRENLVKTIEILSGPVHWKY